MREGEPGWFYIGNGLLQYKDINGWTDQYQDIDGPAKTSDVGAPASTDVLGSGIGEARRQARDPGPLTRLCSSAAHLLGAGFSLLIAVLGRLFVLLTVLLWRSIVGLSRLMVAVGRRVIAGFPRLIAGFRRLVVVLWRLIIDLSCLMVAVGRRVIAGFPRLIAGFPRLIAGFPRLIAGFPRLIAGFSRLKVGLWRLTTSFSRLIVGFGQHMIAGFRRLTTSFSRLIVGFGQHMIAGFQRLTTSFSRLIVGFWRLTTGFWRFVAERCRRASASLSIRSVARRQHDPSKSSILVDKPIGSMKRPSGEPPRHAIPRQRSRFRLGPGQSEEEADFFVHLDPERLKDLNPNAAGVDRRVPSSGNGIEAKPLVDG